MLGLRASRRKFVYDDVQSALAGRGVGWLAPPRLPQLRADRRIFGTYSIKELSIGVAGRLRE
jgi:hypothetical protein